ncbi:EAL domain-containing protein [Chromobacterium sp. CV08]|uniref:EAL domain-containing protein n=1 Tax=Chromobacterium sp. CV08 TaxID=3133274 RepID=UPI003DA8EFD3
MANRRGLHLIIVAAYVLISSAWIVAPDVLMELWGEPDGQVDEMLWDGLYVSISSIFLYLLLSGLGPARLAGLQAPGLAGRVWLRLTRYGAGWLVLPYVLIVLVAVAVPDMFWLRKDKPVAYMWLAAGWDAAFILACAAVLSRCLSLLDDDSAPSEPAHGRRLAYALAVAGSLLMLGVRYQIGSHYPMSQMMLLMLIPVALSAMMGGLGPGLLSGAVIVAGVAYLFIESSPDWLSNSTMPLLSMSLLVLLGVLLSVMSEVQRLARSRLAAALVQRQQAFEEMRHSDERFRALFAGSPVSMAISRLADGELVEANQAFLAQLGLPKESVLGRTTVELGIWNDATERDRLIATLRRSGEVLGWPVALRRGDGTTIQTLLSMRLIHLDGEQHVYGVVLDVTDKHRVQQGLRESEARLAGMVQSAMDGIIALDAEQRVILFNEAAERMFGWREQEMLGQPLDRLLPAKLRAVHHQVVQRFGDSGASTRRMGQLGKVQGMRADGDAFDLEASISSQEIDGRRSYTVILRDITERERVQVDILRHMQQLESLNDLNRAILAADDAEQIAQIGLRYLRRQVPFWGATVMLIDWESENISVLAVERDSEANYDPGQRLSLESYGEEDLARLKRGEACLGADLGRRAQRPATLERLYQQGMRSYARIPLMAEEKLLGILNLGFDVPGGCDEAEFDVAQDYARQLAVCLQQSLLREKVARLGRVYEVLSRVNALVVRCRDREALFDGICRVAVEVGAYRIAWAGVIDPSTQNGTVIAFRGDDGDYLRQIRLSAKEDSPYRDRPACRAARLNEIVVCNDAQGDPSLTELIPHLVGYSIRSIASLPIALDGRAAAVLSLFACDVGAFDRQEIELLGELASDIGFALDHIQKGERLDYLAYYDSLTGLANRQLLVERLAQRMADAAQQGRHCSVVVCDLENFESINDVFGRGEGDQALKLLTERLLRHVRDPSLLARIGGDQFALVLPQAGGEDEAVLGMEQIRRDCLDPPIRLDGNDLCLSARFGIAMHPDDGATAMGLLERAESALKRAKAANEAFLFYRQEMTERAAAALELGSRLRQALELEQFELYYQAKFAAGGQAIVGVEALLRWHCPGQGMVLPSQFVPMLEELGLIVEVGDWVLRQATRDYHGWLSAGLPAPRLSVNVSPLQLRRGDFAQSLAAVLAMYPAQTAVDIEIVESQLMTDIDSSIAILRQLRGLGVSIALDDFGTGYSSLAYLARLPIQTLKIDRSFVSNMLDEEEAMLMVEMIISLAHTMSLEVVAEGVETEAQAIKLAELGCDVLQGFWLGQPLPAAELADRLHHELRGTRSLESG